MSQSGAASGMTLGVAAITAKVDGVAGTAAVIVIPGPAAQLTFTTQPTTVIAGVTFAPLVVTARDVGGNVATGFTGNVTISLGSNPGGGTLLGTTTEAAVSGVATFADLRIEKSGSGYTFQAASGTLTGATSSSVTILPAQAVKTIFAVQPSAAVAGSPLSPAVQVVAADQFGNTVTSFADSVSIAIGTNPGSGTLSGTRRVLAVNGVASFADLSIDRADSGYTLTAVAPTLTPDTSSGFTVGPSTPSARTSTVTASPSTITSSTGSSAAAISVTVHDEFGNPVPGVTVVLAATGAGNTLTQPAGPTNGGGVATGTFSSTVSEVKVVTATAGAIALATTDTVTVNPAAPGALAFTVAPVATVAGAHISPAVVVSAKDAFGNVSTSFTGMVSVAIGNNPVGGTLGGTLSQSAVAGIARFGDLHIDEAGMGYTLAASATGMTAAASVPFDISVGPLSPTQTLLSVSPAVISASTGSSTASITVTVRDALDNPIPGVAVTLAATGLGNTLTEPGAPTNSGGVATGTLSSTVSESKVISATAGGVALAQTDTITVTPAGGGALLFTGQPTGATAGSVITPAVVITAKDQFGNVSAGFTGTVTVAISDNPGGGTLGGTLSKTAIAGVATFSDLQIDKAGSGYTLSATAPGMTAGKSATFNITAGPVSASQTTVTASPASITASNGSSAATITVTARDASGNPIAGATVQVAATGNGNTLTQPAGVTGAGGAATGTLSSTAAETKTITATVNGTAITQQAALTVNPGPVSAAQSTIGAIPMSFAASSGGVTSAITVTANDAFGNPVPGVTVALQATGGGTTVTQPSGTTNASGVASGLLSSTLVGQKVVSATTNGTALTANTTVTVVPGEVSVTQSSLVASLSSITASTGSSVDTIIVRAKDDQGNVIPNVSVVLNVTGSANVIGQPTVTDANGVALGTLRSTFAEAKIISVTIDGTGIGRTDTVTVLPAAPSALAFFAQPTSTIQGMTMSPPVQLEIRDPYANRVTTATNSVELAFGANPGSGTLSGGSAIPAVAGVATFSGLSISAAGTGYTLVASSAGLSDAVSGTFNVSAGVVSAAQSSVSVSPASIVAGSAASAITITARDANGTLLPGVTVTLSATGSGNTIVQPAGLTNGSGVTTGTLSSTVTGTKTVTATANGVTISQQPVISVTPGAIAASQSTVAATPSSIVVSTGTSSIQVTAKDQFGNAVSGAVVTLAASGAGVTLTQPSAATDATGVATGSVQASNTGTVTVSATAGGVALTQTAAVTVTAAGASVVFVGAGDIADCGNSNDTQTAALITAIPNVPVFTLGDNAYPDGSTKDYQNCYDPTWGAFKSRTHPSAGNHEYNTTNAAPYFAYFGAAAGTPGQGYYSFDLGSWHVIVLNSNISTDPGSPQDVWLKADLAAHPTLCTLAYWHHPLYSSVDGPAGASGATITSARPFWDDLYAAGADLVLNGHRHGYERLAPMAPDGTPDPVNGIRTFVAGMGGESGADYTNIFPTSEVREGRTYGVLKLTLSTGSYSWQFVGVPGSTFTDSGTNNCH